MDADETAALERLADAWAQAIVSNDADEIAQFVSDDWVMVSDTGVSPASDFIGLVRSGDLTHSAMERVSAARVRIYGDVALFTARVTNTAQYAGETFAADEWTTDVFVRHGDGWRCVLSHITAARVQ